MLLAAAVERRHSAALKVLPAEEQARLLAALQSCNAAAFAEPAAKAATPEELDPDALGWPKVPYEAAALRQYVLVYTEASQQEKWSEALQARTIGGTYEDHAAEKVFANVLLNKEGSGEEKDASPDHKGIDPMAYKFGKWYRFLNAKGDCFVYVHNYTRDITATKPANYTELSEEEKMRMKRLGTFIKELPEEVDTIYDKKRKIPIVYASQTTCEALRNFAIYDKNWQLCDCTKLKRVNAKALEECRQAVVNAMRYGKTLCLYLGDVVPDIQEKICTPDNKTLFPIQTWTYGCLDTDMVKERIYRADDREGGQCFVQPGFRVCVVLMYDTMNYEMSSFRRDELPSKIPDFKNMEQVRCYSEPDIEKILEAGK